MQVIRAMRKQMKTDVNKHKKMKSIISTVQTAPFCRLRQGVIWIYNHKAVMMHTSGGRHDQNRNMDRDVQPAFMGCHRLLRYDGRTGDAQCEPGSGTPAAVPDRAGACWAARSGLRPLRLVLGHGCRRCDVGFCDVAGPLLLMGPAHAKFEMRETRPI